MSKKILLTIIVLVIIVLGIGVFWYAKRAPVANPLEQSQVPQQQEQEPSVDVMIPSGSLDVVGGGGSLSICVDECGNGACQPQDARCSDGSDLNCICPETPTDCPQDCK